MFNFDSLIINNYKLKYIGLNGVIYQACPTAHHLFNLINNNNAVIQNMIFEIINYILKQGRGER